MKPSIDTPRLLIVCAASRNELRLPGSAVTKIISTVLYFRLMWSITGCSSDWERPVYIMVFAPPWARASAVVAARSPRLRPAMRTIVGDWLVYIPGFFGGCGGTCFLLHSLWEHLRHVRPLCLIIEGTTHCAGFCLTWVDGLISRDVYVCFGLNRGHVRHFVIMKPSRSVYSTSSMSNDASK